MSAEIPTLPATFSSFVRHGSYFLRPEGDALMISSEPGGEVRFYLRRRESGFTLDRAERSEDERLIMWSTTAEAIEKYLIVTISEDVRTVLGLDMIDGPTNASELGEGLHVVPTADGAFAIQRADGSLAPGRFPHAGIAAPIYDYATTVDHSPQSLCDAYLTPDGAPLFTLWQPRHSG
jgi:hypothetical protein